MPENDIGVERAGNERESAGKARKKLKKSDIKSIAEDRYREYLMDNPDTDPIEGGIDIARETCARLAKKKITEMSADMIGVRGGIKEKFNPHSSPMGQDIRDLLKGKTRGYINDLIDKEQAKYKAERYEEINSTSGLTSDEREKKLKEFDNDQKIKEIYLRTSFYDIAKEDVVKRLYKQSETYADEIIENYVPLFEGDIYSRCQDAFRDEFQKTMGKIYDVSSDWAEVVAKEKGAEKVVAMAKKIGEDVFEEHEDSIEKRARTKLMREREALIGSLGGSISGNKMRAVFDGVRDEDYSAAEKYVYEATDEESIESGIKSTEEIKGDIAKNLRRGEFITNDIGRSLKYFSKVIFSLIKADGDSTALNVGFKIPVAEGVSITIGVSGSVINYSNDIIGNIDISVGAAGDAGIASLEGAIGGYMQIKSANSDDFANLISYTLYRQARESKIFPHAITNYIWGSGGRSGKSSYEEAEAYGAMSEKKLFGEGSTTNTARLGLYGKFKGEVGVGGTEEKPPDFGVTFGVKGGAAREYSKRAFKSKGQEDRIGAMEDYKFGGQKSKGQIVGTLKFDLGVAAGLGGGAASLSFIFRAGKVDKIVAQLDGTLNLPMNETGTKFLIKAIVNAVGVVGSNAEKVFKMLSKHKNGEGLENNEMAQVIVSDVGGTGFEAFQAGFSGKPLSDLLENIKDTPEDALKANKSASSFVLSIKYEWIKSKKSEFSISLSSTSAIGVNFGVGSFKVEKGKRLLNWSTDDARAKEGNLAQKAIAGFSM